MTTKPAVSVVVPIYNVEDYLRECVDSILAQTLKNIEVILVDDGSPDSCPKIVDEYAKKDKRVVAVHQKNSGYSIAVNKGIELAKGEYIGIIESDDWIEPDMYEELYNNAKKNNTDITKGGFYKYNSTEDEERRDVYYTNPSGIDLRLAPSGVFKITEWPKLIGFHASIWSAIYRADFIKKIKIPDTAGASYQDFPFMTEFLCKAERITVVKDGFVHWRNDPDQGNSTSAKGKKLLFMAQNSETGVNIVKETGLYDQLKEALMIHVVWTNLGFFYNIDNKYKKEYYSYLYKILKPVKDDPSFKYTYFRPYDKIFFDLVTQNNWPLVRSGLLAMGARRKVKKLMKKLMPGYRVSAGLREELETMMAQNDELKRDIKEIKKQLESKNNK